LQLDTGNVKTFDSFVTALKQALAKLDADRFDYLINNAGTSLHKNFVQMSEEELDVVYNVHFKGVFFLTQKLLPLINDGGRIVNISSGLARFSIPGSSAYASMKGAVEVLTRYLAKELGPRGIVVNTVAPGAIATDFSGGMVRDNPEVNKMVANMTALGRVGHPDDSLTAFRRQSLDQRSAHRSLGRYGHLRTSHQDLLARTQGQDQVRTLGVCRISPRSGARS